MLVYIPSHLTIAGSTQDVISICGMLSVYLIARTWLCDQCHLFAPLQVKHIYFMFMFNALFKKAYDMPISLSLHKQLTNTKL